jgi:hypothetical protein
MNCIINEKDHNILNLKQIIKYFFLQVLRQRYYKLENISDLKQK